MIWCVYRSPPNPIVTAQSGFSAFAMDTLAISFRRIEKMPQRWFLKDVLRSATTLTMPSMDRSARLAPSSTPLARLSTNSISFCVFWPIMLAVVVSSK